VCLYEALCGHRITSGSYEDLNTKDESIPPAIDELILKCIAAKPVRLSTAEEFQRGLASAFQSHAPLSTVLARGQLHEVMATIREMEPNDFIQLPPGQRLLILSKCQDVVLSDDARLGTARADFLSVLPVLAHLISPTDYAEIVAPAIDHGFGREEQYAYSYRDRSIREAMNRAAEVVGQQNHSVIVKALLEWVERGGGLAGRPHWYYHALRLLVTRLMANTHCSDADARKLADKLAEINKCQRGDNGAKADGN
jgi:hypothetical protein